MEVSSLYCSDPQCVYKFIYMHGKWLFAESYKNSLFSTPPSQFGPHQSSFFWWSIAAMATCMEPLGLSAVQWSARSCFDKYSRRCSRASGWVAPVLRRCSKRYLWKISSHSCWHSLVFFHCNEGTSATWLLWLMLPKTYSESSVGDGAPRLTWAAKATIYFCA